MDSLGFICLPEGLPGHPPAGPENCPFLIKNVLARSNFRKAGQIKIPGMFERAEGLKTSQMRDSRNVSMLRSAQNLAKYVIHGRFQCSGVRNNLARYMSHAVFQ